MQVEPGLDVGAPEEVGPPGVLLLARVVGVQDEGAALGATQEVCPQGPIRQDCLGQGQHRPQSL